MVRVACQVPSALVPAARDSSSRRACSSSVIAREDVVQLAGDDLLGEVQRVGAGEQREQPALVHAVVEEQLLLGRPRSASNWRRRTAYFVAIASATLAGVDAGAADADPALDEGAEHREEAPVGVLDRRSRRRPSGVTSANRLSSASRGTRTLVEPDPAVVDAVEAHLAAVVLDPDAGRRARRPRGSARRTRARPRSSPPTSSWAKTTATLGVRGGVADVVLAGRRRRAW